MVGGAGGCRYMMVLAVLRKYYVGRPRVVAQEGEKKPVETRLLCGVSPPADLPVFLWIDYRVAGEEVAHAQLVSVR